MRLDFKIQNLPGKEAAPNYIPSVKMCVLTSYYITCHAFREIKSK